MTDDHVDADSDLDFEPEVTDLGFEPAVTDLGFERARAAGEGARNRRGGVPDGLNRRGGFRRKLTSFAVLVGALTTVGGGYALLAPSSGADNAAVSSADIEKGRQFFQVSCISCHGANLQGVTGRGPSLIGTGSAATYFQVSTGRMPATGQGANNLRKTARFTEEESRWLAAYVDSVGGGPSIPEGDLRVGDAQMAEGGDLFRLNCASCHNASGGGGALSAGKVAPGLGKATDVQIYTAMLSGPENMPVFSDNQITPEQKRAIITYIQNLKASKDPGGAGMARIGPVSEGLVIWTVGLGVLIMAILWIGRKA